MDEMNFSNKLYIKNRGALGTTKLRRDAVEIIEAGFSAVDTKKVIHEQLVRTGDIISTGKRNINASKFDRVFIVAVGKCAVDSASVLDEILGDLITDGIVLDVKEGAFKHLRSFVGTHPFSSEQNVIATKAIISLLSDLTKKDLVLMVISGGGSALLSMPHNISVDTLNRLLSGLWKCGATIGEVNTVRKHLSKIAGGQMAKLAYPATIISLLFSDVPRSSPDMIASGPTVLDTTIRYDAHKILQKYKLCHEPRLADIELIETPKNKKYFKNITNIVIVNNDKALCAMKSKAESLGYFSKIEANAIEGIARELGEVLALKKMKANSCLLYGGESTVLIKGDGKGGRCQELALSAAEKINNHRVVVAVSSDGWDNGDIAGAIADAGDRERARAQNLSITEFIRRNDSYNFWQACGGGIETGRTGINVSDFYFVLTE